MSHDGQASPEVLSLRDLEARARLVVDTATWDFIAGGSEDESTLGDNVEAYRRWRLLPRVLSGVASADLTTSVLGAPLASPILVAPTAYHRLLHDEGERATARGCADAGSVFVLSTMSSISLEEVASASSAQRWLQIYVNRDRAVTVDLVQRAKSARYGALVLTVDAPRLGRRERDLRNGFALPKHLAAAHFPPQELLHDNKAGHSAIAQHAAATFDPALQWDIIPWLRALGLPVVVKGILTREDARLAVEHGAAAIIVSNHGGRQLDGVPATLDCLTDVVDGADGRVEIYLDGGIRRGTDVLKALALGARAVLIGRPILWGLAVAGARGVFSVIEMLKVEMETAMVLAGRRSVMDLDASLLRRAP